MTEAFKLLRAFIIGVLVGLAAEAYARSKEDPEDEAHPVIR